MKLAVEAAVVDGELVPGGLEIVDGRIARFGVAGPGRGIAVPGFVDLQVNGFAGIDFLAAGADEFAAAGDALAVHGVTAYQPTFISSPPASLCAALEALETARRASAGGARILGAHLEGPFLSPAHAGAHPRDALLTPDATLLERFLAATAVTTVTLAPELDGAFELIDLLGRRGCVVSCGHSGADSATAHRAFDAGARAVTHLFNAMGPFHHRRPGLAGVALARQDVVVGVIADGVHVSDDALQTVWNAARGRIALVTDAIAAAGTGVDMCRLGGVEVTATERGARRADDTLAGSVLTMGAAVRRMLQLGARLTDAVRAASTVPAALLGRRDIGALVPGRRADIVVLDDAVDIDRVLIGGRLVVA